MTDMPSTSSYLDQEDPFNTTLTSQAKIKTPVYECLKKEVDISNTVHDAFGKAVEPIVQLSSSNDEDNDDILQQCHPSAKEIIDAPSEWDFSRFSAAFSDSDHRLPDDLLERTENLLKVNLDDEEALTENQLRTLVSISARLLNEHDLLINSRSKLFEAMNRMQQSEREATMQLYSQLNPDFIDNASRKLIMELFNKLGGSSTPKEDSNTKEQNPEGIEKNTFITTPCSFTRENVVPSNGLEHISPTLFCVPPPDPTRPPPGFCVEQIVPDVNFHNNRNMGIVKTSSHMVPSPLQRGAPHSAPPAPCWSRFPVTESSPRPPTVGVSFYQLPPPPMFVGSPVSRQFCTPNRVRAPLLIIDPNNPMAKLHVNYIAPGTSIYPRRRFSSGNIRRGKGSSYLRK